MARWLVDVVAVDIQSSSSRWSSLDSCVAVSCNSDLMVGDLEEGEEVEGAFLYISGSA